jgi:protein PhnA
MNDVPPCPHCSYEYTYENGSVFVCPECNHEWSGQAATLAAETRVWKDAFGQELKNGDSVMVIKDLKVRGASSTLKAGTKVKGIRLIEGDHDIDCKIDGFGAMQLKSEFVKKA